ncbi:Acyl-CoA N-acyltransferase,GNAT domain [Cinara cedri]|uniref:Acyl-CoA N-acyltransferase,GNAT domain n=1 Tax=Cinara cedri TaxID=506608 RepID=A0A5E4MBZ1_9HEMI|nr:Acyl-CoA N-acyltransferase,GNAT domain [Cinara cedri]
MSEIDNVLTENWEDEFLSGRMELPRVWVTLENGFEIQELQSHRVDEVIEMIKKHYIFEEPIFVGSQIYKDNESVEQYLYLARHWIMDTLSTIAVDKKTNSIVGFLICRFNELFNRDPEMSRERIYSGKTWKELQKFKHYLTKRSNPYKHYKVDNILEIYSWFVLPRYRKKGIGTELLRNVMHRQLPEYKWFELDVIVGMFTSDQSQRIAKSLEMKTLYDFVYAGWTITNKSTGKDERFFKTMKPDSNSATVMSFRANAAVESQWP